MTQPTDDLAAQMAREMEETGCVNYAFPAEIERLEAIARRYMEKAREEENLSCAKIADDFVRAGRELNKVQAETAALIAMFIRTSRAKKDSDNG